ncbi:LysE family translocator [Oceanospirillum beijerinckii]|uniref:LysE family translocator n=1 Tax=Oceanospirillum beijerinckii TaxID=64976 RepID=UPI00040176B2|nr:LysE family translocator [Oceanospirillum beijerinckii]
MDIIQIFSFMLVAALLVISPGPNGVLIAKTVPVSGKAAGFANIGGFIAAFFVHGSLSVFGLSVLLVQSAQAFTLFKLLGAAYLCWIGIKSLMQAWQNKPVQNNAEGTSKPTSLEGAFAEGFLTNALNPKVSMFYLAAFPQFIPVDGSVATAFMLVVLHAIINLAWFSTMVILLARIKQASRNSAFSRWLKSVTGAVFIGFGAKLAFMKPAE